MANEASRVLVPNSQDKYVHFEEGVPKGICVDLWRRIRNHLHLEDAELLSDSQTAFQHVFDSIENNSVDFIVSRMDENVLEREKGPSK